MNALDKSQTHLDPNQLSYPGDYHTLLENPDSSAKATSQVGGWDKPPETYRTTSTSHRPPSSKDSKYSSSRNNNYDNNKPYNSQSTQHLNSFNLFDQSPESSVIKSESLNLNPLKLLSDANPGVEFTLEPSSNPSGSSNGADSYGSGSSISNTYESQYKDYPAWKAYPQSAHEVYGAQDSQTMSSTRQDTTYSQYPNPAAAYENGNVDQSTKLHQYNLAQDYIPRDRPVSDLSDSYSPHAGGRSLSTDLVPPSEAAAVFKRQAAEGGTRKTRQENTPMVEIDGLSLFKDILSNEKAHGTRNQLYKAMTS